MRWNHLFLALFVVGCAPKGDDTGAESGEQPTNNQPTKTNTNATSPETGTETGTETETGLYPMTGEDYINLAYLATQLPPLYVFFSELFIEFTHGTCPEITATETSRTVVGDCTTDKGAEWTGSATMTEKLTDDEYVSTMVYENFGLVDADGGFMFDGTIQLSGDVISKKERSWTAFETQGFTIQLIDAAEGLELVYADYLALGDLSTTMFGGAPGSVEFAGDVSVTGLGELSFSGNPESTGLCPDEVYDQGSMVMVGADTATLEYDGAKSCDGCLPWSTTGGLSGELCTE